MRYILRAILAELFELRRERVPIDVGPHHETRPRCWVSREANAASAKKAGKPIIARAISSL